MLKNMSNDNLKILIDDIYRNEYKSNNYIISCESCEEGTRCSIISNDQNQPYRD